MAKNNIMNELWIYLQRGFWFFLFGLILGIIAVVAGIIGVLALIQNGNVSLILGIIILLSTVFILLTGAGFLMQYVVDKKKAKLTAWWLNIKRGFVMEVFGIFVGLILTAAGLNYVSNLNLITALIQPVLWTVNGYIITKIVEDWIER